MMSSAPKASNSDFKKSAILKTWGLKDSSDETEGIATALLNLSINCGFSSSIFANNGVILESMSDILLVWILKDICGGIVLV